MLRIAVQAKGRLFEETMALLEESDIKLSTTKRTLLVQSSNFPIEVLFLREFLHSRPFPSGNYEE